MFNVLFSIKIKQNYLFTVPKDSETRIYMNLICCICNDEISEDAKIAKIISIKRIQHYGTDARIEYTDDQEELYVHFNCLRDKDIPIISCPANNEDFNERDSRIIDKTETNLESLKKENIDSLTRSNILNF